MRLSGPSAGYGERGDPATVVEEGPMKQDPALGPEGAAAMTLTARELAKQQRQVPF
jgi:hypothetical protein